MGRWHLGLSGLVLLLATGCGSAEGLPKAAPGPTTTATVTAPAPTATATKTATATVTIKVTRTVVAEPDPEPSPPQEESPATPEGEDDFDEGWARDIASDIVEDLGTVDERLGDGIAVSSALYLLADSYDSMLEAGVPTSADPAKYTARLETLSSFAETAGDEYEDHPTQGSARYSVVRKETGTLFAVLNAEMGTNYQLP